MVATAHFLALISPGPDFFIIVSTSVRNGAAKALSVCAGITLANGVFICMAIAGFTLIKDNVWILNSMKISGGCFLFYMGYALIKSSRRDIYSGDKLDIRQSGTKKLFVTGFLSAIANPKNPIFYMSLYSLFLSGDTNLNKQLIYGLWMFSAVFLWDAFVALSVGNSFIKSFLSNYVHRIEQVSGFVIILLGITLALN